MAEDEDEDPDQEEEEEDEDEEDEEDDDEESALPSLGEEVPDTLTRRQREALLNHLSLEYEDEYYLNYYHYLSEGLIEFQETQKIDQLSKLVTFVSKDGGEINKKIEELVNERLERSSVVLQTGMWLERRCDNIPEHYQLLAPEEALDEDCLAWGRALRKHIDDDEVLRQYWSARRIELELEVKTNWKEVAEILVKMTGKKEGLDKLYQMAVEQSRAISHLAEFDLKAHRAVMEHVREKYWSREQIVTNEILRDLYDRYHTAHDAERKEMFEKANKDLESSGSKFQLAEIPSKVSTSSKTSNEDQEEIHQMPTVQQTPTQKKIDTETRQAEQKAKFTNVSVMYVDDPNVHRIALPMDMDYDTAIDWLKTIKAEENRLFNFVHKFRSWFPLDAMWAVYRALAETYGFTHVGDFKGFWGEKIPPTSLTVEIGYGQKQQIPWGPVEVHGLSAPLEPKIVFDKGLPALSLSAEIKNSERPIVDKIIAKTEELLRTSSIYRGKAVEIDFTVFNPRDINFDVERAPRFMDTNVTEQELILPEAVADLVETGLWTPIRNTAVCREHKIPLRRGVLLAGKYGVGKTLAARVTAMLCEKHGWTFLYVKDLNQIEQALYFAKHYGPCVVFAEDINRVVSGDRDASMDKIFNVIDGVDRKSDEVMVIFTTNDLDDIHAGMLRPGRIDTVITVAPPDAVAAARLVRYYGRNIIDPEADLTQVGVLLDGQIPAIIREAVERSKLSAIKDTKPGETLVVRAEHLKTAAKQMLEHAKLLEEPEGEPSDLEILGEAIGGVIAKGIRAEWDDRGRDNDLSDEEAVKKLPGHLLDEAGRPGNNKHVVD